MTVADELHAAALTRRYRGYAAKVSAETVRAEPAVVPDLSDAGLAAILDCCVRPARPAEYSAVRAAFAAMTAAEFNADIAACEQCDNAPRCFCAKHLAMASSVTS